MVTGISVVGGQEGECRGNIWSGTCSQPVDTADNTLIAFGTSFQVRVGGIRRRDGIDGYTRSIRSHVGDGIELINCKAVSGIFGKGGLDDRI